jgi:hypothetical protein
MLRVRGARRVVPHLTFGAVFGSQLRKPNRISQFIERTLLLCGQSREALILRDHLSQVLKLQRLVYRQIISLVLVRH